VSARIAALQRALIRAKDYVDEERFKWSYVSDWAKDDVRELRLLLAQHTEAPATDDAVDGRAPNGDYPNGKPQSSTGRKRRA
jgi:hypothetical protein